MMQKGTQFTRNYVWDVGTLSWVPMQQPTLEADSVAVTIAGTLTTKETRGASSAVTSVADNAGSVTLLAANANRLTAFIANTSSARLLVKLGATASAGSYSFALNQWEWKEVTVYTGVIDGIWASDPDDGVATITEITA